MRVALVMIEWLDSRQPIARWQHLCDMDCGKPIRCASVGWLVRDDAEIKALAPNMGAIDDPDYLQACGVITIPTLAVIRMRRLKEPSVSAASGWTAGLSSPLIKD